jgi:NADP-dependent 3-hydroxy acid dehydrogenase YdfG
MTMTMTMTMTNPFDLENSQVHDHQRVSPGPSRERLVFITGASSGIGQALALAYHRAGWTLWLCARKNQPISDWAKAWGLDMSRIHIHSADARDTRTMADAGLACIASLGVPDTVIACAGISVGVGFDNAEFDDLNVMRAIFETNNMGLAA